MAHQIVSTTWNTCSGLGSQTMSWAPGGTVVSIGFQNGGYAQNFWVSQMFVETTTSVFIQVVNSSVTATSWRAVCVIDTDPTPNPAAEPEIKTVPYQAPR